METTKITKKSTALVAATLGMLALLQPQARAQEISVRVNGNSVAFADTHPQRRDGRVLVPLRGVLEEIGADISWNEATQTVKAHMGQRDIQLTLGSNTAMVNGQSVGLRVPAMRIGGSTMVPLRFIGEALGASVDWDEPRQQVSITTNMAPGAARPPMARNRERDMNTNQNRDRGQAGNRILLRVDGRDEPFGAARPYMRGDDVMVPLEQLARVARFSYRYDATQNSLVVPEKKLSNAVGSRWIEKNGQRIRLESPTEVRTGTLFVPLEFIELSSDQTATWNAETRTIVISARRL
jgi:Copper amine oxidase N-terminal domain